MPSRIFGRRGFGRRLLLGAAALSALSFPAAGHAQDQASVAAPIQRLYDGLLTIMRQGRTASFMQRFQTITPDVTAALDLPAILAAAVGLRWASLDPAAQNALLAQFTDFTVATYVSNFSSYSGQRFEILPGLRPVPGGGQILNTRLVSTSGDNHVLDYVMRDTAGGWKATDVLLDGSISRVAVLRSDFREILSTGGPTRLADDLRRKAADMLGGFAPT